MGELTSPVLFYIKQCANYQPQKIFHRLEAKINILTKKLDGACAGKAIKQLCAAKAIKKTKTLEDDKNLGAKWSYGGQELENEGRINISSSILYQTLRKLSTTRKIPSSRSENEDAN